MENTKNFRVKKYGKEVLRNELCPCGSGKKYKQCCWKKDALEDYKLNIEEIAKRDKEYKEALEKLKKQILQADQKDKENK